MRHYNILPNDVYKITDKNAHIYLSKSTEMQRIGAFLFFNKRIYIGKNHILIFDLLNISDEEKESYLQYRFLRKKSILNINNAIAFGSILKGNVAVIDSYANIHCTNDEICQALLVHSIYKIYYGMNFNLYFLEIHRLY